jgi:dTDP-4-amino-4,6-dideoxygalactose transaminase
MNQSASQKSSGGFAPWPVFADDERAAVEAVLRSGKVNYWTGTEGRLFEQEFAKHVGVKYAVALANGTVALEAALFALGIGRGDDVVVSCRTFIASASAVVVRGARPVMADVDSESQNVTAETLRAAITPATKALLVVHLAGRPCEMEEIMALANDRGLKVIEDCAQAHGATCRGRVVGSFGHVSAYSFCQDKIMTTGGEGGMLVTDDPAIWRKVWSYKDHGKNYELMQQQNPGPGFRWVHESFGTNWRMTEMQSAIGRIQLRKLSDWVAARRRHAALLDEAFKHVPGLRISVPPSHIHASYYKHYAWAEPERLEGGWDRDRILREVLARGIPCFTGICPEIYLEKAFQKENLASAKRLPAAERLGETSLMFLVHPTLTDEDMRRTGEVVREVMKLAVAKS